MSNLVVIAYDDPAECDSRPPHGLAELFLMLHSKDVGIEVGDPFLPFLGNVQIS